MGNTRHIKTSCYSFSFGELILGSFDKQLCLCDWRYRKMRQAIDNRLCQGLDAEMVPDGGDVIDEAIEQLKEYELGKRNIFDLPLTFVGTDFQKSVWNALLEIPYGKTETYLGLSEKVGNRKAIRAVAAANGANALSILVPCHRVIGASGDLVGYAGGISVKKRLLKLESVLPLFPSE